VPRTQLDALEERGYLDPDKRGERAAEIEAVECYLGEYADPAGLSLDVARVCD